ncbi:serum response factor-binding protein 1 [Genypterus blacodes]|uniref:serum response factor-binding protein 1 n=1 Tax=Genypterus blacodes TaxID=154954 RepID=UPI003F7610A7
MFTNLKSAMIQFTDMGEKMVPTAEENQQAVEEKKTRVHEEEDKGTGDDGEHDKEKDEPTPQAPDKTEDKQPAPNQPKEKNGEQVLNLNNEVVKMRKEVKRVRALLIRKLTRQISALKKKKGKEMEVERNQRRATRLLEEIHAMKALQPDKLTKTALEKSFNFEEVCKNPKCTISDRAVARIATHPQFNKKVQAIRAAVEAFKEERMKDGKRPVNKELVQSKAEKVTPQLPDTHGEGEDEEEEGYLSAEGKETIDDVEGESLLNVTEEATFFDLSDWSKPPPAETAEEIQIPEAKSVKPAATKHSHVKDSPKIKQSKAPEQKKPNKKPAPQVSQKEEEDDDEEEESDVESSDDEEEKEYFDDSTEERFHKQSSQSEDSDDEDDFFLGKVSTMKKKKKNSVEREKKDGDKSDLTGKPTTSDQGQRELDELESRLKSKAKKLQNVFCPSLSGSKASGGAGRGRGGSQSRGQGNQRDGRNFARTSKFQEQHKDRQPRAESVKLHREGRQPESQERGSAFGGRGRGRGRDARRGGGFTPQVQQQALHPSWEASRKRKEQQGQILAFQGKKIKFDD